MDHSLVGQPLHSQVGKLSVASPPPASPLITRVVYMAHNFLATSSNVGWMYRNEEKIYFVKYFMWKTTLEAVLIFTVNVVFTMSCGWFIAQKIAN